MARVVDALGKCLIEIRVFMIRLIENNSNMDKFSGLIYKTCYQRENPTRREVRVGALLVLVQVVVISGSFFYF
jgi:hypothetical protein